MVYCDYSLIVFDAEAILTEYETVGKFSIVNLHCSDKRIEEAIEMFHIPRKR